ncbi:MAG: MBL fold metallo-hydrolase [Simkania sp.]|nr:MBL fold metallo-hydrolase [Simkania sp.]
MIVEVFASGPAETNSVLVCTDSSPQAVLFDAPLHCVTHWQSRLKQLGKTVGTLLITHSHWDHIADAAAAKKAWNMPVGIHKEDVGNLEKPGSDGLPLWFPIEGIGADFYVVNGEEKRICDLKVCVMHTPGHTSGCVCYYLPDLKVVISGDTLFQGSIGNLSFATARPKLMEASLKTLLNLPADTVVMPGHGDATTIGKEQGIIKRFFYD